MQGRDLVEFKIEKTEIGLSAARIGTQVSETVWPAINKPGLNSIDNPSNLRFTNIF